LAVAGQERTAAGGVAGAGRFVRPGRWSGRGCGDKQMTTNDILGWLASIGSIVYLSVGLPFQIHRNYRNKSTKGLSLPLVVFMCISIVLWLAYAWTKQPKDLFILASNIPGLLFSVVLLIQSFVYKGD
jgi:uncharacterized protein with PQ loop repeat